MYSGKLRSYLRKKVIPFRELNPSVRVYKNFIFPRTGVRYIPILQTPEDEVLQDTTVIIDFLEERFPHPSVYPRTPARKLAALLLELFGDEWMVNPAMHYRWSCPEQNQPFIYGEFGRMAFPLLPGFLQTFIGRKLGSRFSAMVPLLGVTERTRDALESWYEALLAELQTHFSAHDYLLGNAPCIGDFGMIAAMYAHLWRDPAPGSLMREKAPAVSDWVERMVSAEAMLPDDCLDDSIPETLWPVLKRITVDQLPVLEDTATRLQKWTADKAAESEGSENSDVKVPRRIGTHKVNINGVEENRVVLPHSLWMWQRPLDYWCSLTGEKRVAADRLLDRIDATKYFTDHKPVRVKRSNNRYFLGEARVGGAPRGDLLLLK